MADTKISDLAAVTTVDAADEFVLARSGATKKITGANLETELAGAAGPTVVRKTATESVTASTALQDDDHLLFAIAASEIWAVQFILKVDGATAGDAKFHVNGPSGVGGWFGVLGPQTGVAGFDNHTVANEADIAVGGAAAPGIGTLGANNWQMVLVNALVVNGATPGNVTLQWAQLVSNGTATRVASNSFLIAHLIA